MTASRAQEREKEPQSVESMNYLYILVHCNSHFYNLRHKTDASITGYCITAEMAFVAIFDFLALVIIAIFFFFFGWM